MIYNFKDEFGEMMEVIAEYIESASEKYTKLTIGDRIERTNGSLFDLAITPMAITHLLGDKELNF